MEGFVSNEWGLFFFLDDVMAAAAATPTTPAATSCAVTSFSMATLMRFPSSYALPGLLGLSSSSSSDAPVMLSSSMYSIASTAFMVKLIFGMV